MISYCYKGAIMSDLCTKYVENELNNYKIRLNEVENNIRSYEIELKSFQFSLFNKFGQKTYFIQFLIQRLLIMSNYQH